MHMEVVSHITEMLFVTVITMSQYFHTNFHEVKAKCSQMAISTGWRYRIIFSFCSLSK